MSLRNKLLASFVGLTVLVSLSGVIGLFYMGSINKTLNRITDVAAPTVETSDRLIVTIWQANSVVEAILASENQNEITEFQRELRRLKTAFDRAYAELQDLIDDPALFDDLELARVEHQQFVEHSNEAIAQQLLALEKELDCEGRLAKFDATGATLRTMLDEFASENETEMQKAEDAGDALAASGTATATEVNDLLAALIRADATATATALTTVADTADRISDAADELAAKSVSTARLVIAMTITAGVALALLLGISIMRAITGPLTALVETVETVAARGDLSQRARAIGDNELGTMSLALNRLLIHLETQAGVADDVAQGILETPIEVLSKSDTLGIALRHMTDTLRKNAEEAATHDWLSAGQTRINDQVRGILEIDSLAERVIDSLSKHVHAHRAALFIHDEANGRLHFAAGYADGDPLKGSPEPREGEGLLGQVTRDRQPLLIDQVPPGYFKIGSALGQATPGSMIVFGRQRPGCTAGVTQ